eukprot:1906820-Alexandrium_andersonii.AAC.1
MCIRDSHRERGRGKGLRGGSRCSGHDQRSVSEAAWLKMMPTPPLVFDPLPPFMLSDMKEMNGERPRAAAASLLKTQKRIGQAVISKNKLHLVRDAMPSARAAARGAQSAG